jgi:hypothetical protein
MKRSDAQNMLEVVIPEDDMKRLETRFGPRVRRIGAWNSDGVFSYTTIPVAVLEQAAETLGDATLIGSVARLKASVSQTQALVKLLEDFGRTLIEALAVSYGTYLRHLSAAGATLVCRIAV